MKSKMGVIQLGGIACILSGILFLAQQLFLLPVPHPPAPDGELLAWLAEWKLQLSMADELLVFAALLLIPAVVAIYRVLAKTDLIKALLGCGLLALNIPVYMILVVVLGRLVYPVYDIELSPESYRLVLSLYYGGLHLAFLIFGLAIILLSFAIRKSPIGKPAAYLGFLTGVLAFASAYPWLMGNGAVLAIQLVFTAWLMLVGIRLLDRKVGNV
ncbi:hypothetical protein [Paenibacillus mesotrionivorans]|uniref:Uncharacterized protein n=1 Tax=Paenibacillus mesotrionivorans TaxID=3160968 RepID=A0ACC7NYI5_9BACL